MVTVMTWISFIGGHVEVITDKQQQYYIVETTHAGVQAEDVEDTARNTGGTCRHKQNMQEDHIMLLLGRYQIRCY